ncbi:MAG: gliding motility-associated C-terminal domain-containing protein [Chitinophagales bacterium]|nr:gliding motility-associated C-terminal domain-containing protein [Chitinophagales bacterium]
MRNGYVRILLLFLLLFAGKAKADHFAAGDLYVVYVGAGLDGCTGTTEYKYEVYFDQYKACDRNPVNAATLATTVNIQYRSATAAAAGLPGATGNVVCNFVSQDTLDQLCEVYHNQNSCYVNSVTAPIGFDRVRVMGTVTLPYPQPDWTFYFWSCCTSNNLINVPSYEPFYLETMLNNVVKYNNSTPRFNVTPLPYICNGNASVFLNGPSDVNGDSLRTYNIFHYTHMSPIAAPTWLAFNPGYSLADPMGSASSNPYRMDTMTGAAYFTPQNAGRYTFDFQCDEYDPKTKVLTGYIRRTCEVNILNCSYPPPTIDTTPLTITGGTLQASQKRVITCPGNNLTFTINGKSLNALSNVYLDVLNIIPGATYTVAGQGTSSPVGTFSWIPTAGDIGEHSMTFVSKDSTCNSTGTIIVQKNFVVVKIKVVAGIDVGPDRPICKLSPLPQQLFVRGYDNLNSLVWTDINGGPAKDLSSSTIHNPIASPKTTTSYIVTAPELVGNCRLKDTVTIFEDTTNAIDIFPHTDNFVMCRPDYLQLDVDLKGKGPRNNLPCGPSIIPEGILDSAYVYGSSIFGYGFSFDTVGTISPLLHNNAHSTKQQYLIKKDELREFGMRSLVLRGLSFETTKSTSPNTYEYRNFRISVKCTNKTELNPTLGFETGLIPVYTATGPTFFPNGEQKFKLDTPFDLDSTKNLVIEICYSDNDILGGCSSTTGTNQPPLVRYMPTTYVSMLELKAPDALTTTVCGVNTSPNIKEYKGRPVLKMLFDDAPALPFEFKWFPGEYLSDSSVKQPLAYVNKSTRYSVETIGTSGCYERDTLDIFVPQHDFYALPKDTAICFGETAPLEIRNGTYYKWYEYENGQYKSAHQSLSCDLCASPVAKPKKTTHYKIAVGDEVFCFDTIDAYITVKPLPVVKILTPDTMVKAGQSLQLMVNGARLYNWSPVASLNNPNISYPIATPTESTMYVVAGIASNGCRSFDTVRVGVDYRSNLIVPTAFSPNADGKNDVFRVSNMTVQRYVEFRVFNRWGQEVYNGTDGRKGWDGTWKGVPQEIGNYQYLIRVAYPDGFVETYKGDVTLVR